MVPWSAKDLSSPKAATSFCNVASGTSGPYCFSIASSALGFGLSTAWQLKISPGTKYKTEFNVFLSIYNIRYPGQKKKLSVYLFLMCWGINVVGKASVSVVLVFLGT